ncbi:hypothetical protein RD1_A0028 (plasmid) [Roseobacter denitrificans OCh 114]|uniref:Uncharacterized protein n=1 Tax=Roseobacter denitrificans (strain ATCC 33942 / OCh 114) TaxID=375451 RepID=Q07GR9_ROSDO|nr:hypothetical protein RD1_A0028 [Roseobacter denitrificans OCh 114]
MQSDDFGTAQYGAQRHMDERRAGITRFDFTGYLLYASLKHMGCWIDLNCYAIIFSSAGDPAVRERRKGHGNAAHELSEKGRNTFRIIGVNRQVQKAHDALLSRFSNVRKVRDTDR